MNRKSSQHDQYYAMANEPVQQVIPRLAVPTIISMLISSVYNMADTFFVSQLGTSASGAVGIIFSAMAFIQALSFMVGMGSGNYLARLIGSGNRSLAEKIASIAFFTGLGIGLLIAIFGNLNLDALVRFLGATQTIAPYAKAYARYIFFAAPFMVCSLIMNNLLRFQGNTFLGMVGITTGGILNIFLDPIFIFVFGMGTSGAALATGLSQFVSFSILLCMCNLRKEAITLSPANFKPTPGIYAEIIHGGLPSLGRQGISCISTIVLNTMAGAYGDAAIAAMSIVTRITLFIGSAVIGFGQGFQPVCSYCFGAGLYSRVREAVLFCIKVGTVILIVLCAVGFILSGDIIALFRADDAEVIRIGTFALRAQLLTSPLQGVIVMGNMAPQSMGYGFRSTLVSTARQGIFLIPALFLFSRLLGLTGIQLAQPAADIATFLLSAIVLKQIFDELKSSENKKNAGAVP